MTDTGAISSGTTQIGEVQRPLAAVSKLSKAGNITIFSEGEDWIIDRRDPLAERILELVRKVKRKTQMYEHRGTYRMRAWLIPEGPAGDKVIATAAPFVGQGS